MDTEAAARRVADVAEAIVDAAWAAGNFHRRAAEMLSAAARRARLGSLGTAEAWALLSLAAQPPGTATVSSLSRAGGNTARRAIQQLKVQGYVEGAPSPADRRVAVLTLTESGRRAAADLLLSVRILMDAGFADMPRHLGDAASDIAAAARRLGGPVPA